MSNSSNDDDGMRSFTEVKQTVNDIVEGKDFYFKKQRDDFLSMDTEFQDIVKDSLDDLAADPQYADYNPSQNMDKTFRIIASKILSHRYSPKTSTILADLVTEAATSKNVSIRDNLRRIREEIDGTVKEGETFT
jgi:hypothetical protein